jgi:hypothetical protein
MSVPIYYFPHIKNQRFWLEEAGIMFRCDIDLAAQVKQKHPRSVWLGFAYSRKNFVRVLPPGNERSRCQTERVSDALLRRNFIANFRYRAYFVSAGSTEGRFIEK